jgi:GGDEF domain-containing protein/HAMP domain-containing protein
MLILAALAVAMADNLARPVMRLVQAVNNMSSGKLDTRVSITSSGELGVLENGFNQMAARIEEVHLSMQSRIEEATAQLAFQARHDALTGLLNRREFEHRLAKALASVQAGDNEFAVLFLDLDRFKQVNDTCGYLAGDELLRQMALLFQGRLREEDTLARLGGDEFSIILANCSGPAPARWPRTSAALRPPIASSGRTRCSPSAPASASRPSIARCATSTKSSRPAMRPATAPRKAAATGSASRK